MDGVLRGHRPRGPAARRSDPLVRRRRRPEPRLRGQARRYQRLADEHFEKERYLEFCAAALPNIDEIVLEWVSSDDFDQLLRDTVAATYPEHEQERFLAHFRGLVDLWMTDEATRLAA